MSITSEKKTIVKSQDASDTEQNEECPLSSNIPPPPHQPTYPHNTLEFPRISS